LINYDKISGYYTQHRQNVHPGVMKGLLENSKFKDNTKVLEVGCGTANYILALQSITGCKCWGIDPSNKMLSVARKRSTSINFKIGRAEQLDFSFDFFDLIFSVDVIHHIKDHLEYFKEAFRTLKPEGRICTATDSEWIIKNRRPLATHFPETIEVELVRYPKISVLTKQMKQAGLIGINGKLVEFEFNLKDIQGYRDKAFSSLHLISEEAFQRGITRLEEELEEKGNIRCVSRYFLLWGSKNK
jgi:ubiquinone/menaquinone biosynthesis C-methylase UbiE